MIKKQLYILIKKYKIYKHLSSILAVCAAFSTIATYISITNSSNPFGPDPKSVLGLILIDLVLFLALIITVSRKLISIWGVDKSKSGDATLQKRIVLMFSLGTAIPTIIVAIFSSIFFNYGIQSWFNQKVSTAIEESVAVAEAYLKEHKANIKSDALSMANDLNSEVYNLSYDAEYFSQFIENQANARYLSEVIVFRISDGKILARSRLSFSLGYALKSLTEKDFENANAEQVIILADDKKDRVRALVKLNNFFSTYMLVGRLIDSKILAHTEASQGAAHEYNRLKSEISRLQIQFSFIFLIGSMLLLVSSIARGLVFATEITDPIKQLLKATDLVKSGDFTSRVKESNNNDEISTLGRSFNLMTEQIAKQRNELIEASKQIDARRHFNEIIIDGVSAGIVAVSINKTIDVINKSACNMLMIQAKEILQKNIVDICPEFIDLLGEVELNPNNPVQSEINIMRKGRKIVLLVRIVAEQFDNHLRGYIITFDDITALLVAQRSAAWSDVARRIAHEVKNPLTPIRLASERLRKKYAHEVTEHETFTKYTDTIIRHVASISSIIDEFVNFARIPSPVFKKIDLLPIVNNAVFSRQCANHSVEFKLNSDYNEIIISADEAQIDRILINILKNSEESIEQSSNAHRGLIAINIGLQEQFVAITITDNGAGFQPIIINRLSEPYVTTKSKGTGLGLAIVKKIIDDHNGFITFSNYENTGAIIKILLPR